MPQDWKIYTIEELCKKVYSGGTPLTTNNSYYGGSIPWLNTKEVDFRSITTTEKFITDEGLKNSSAKWVPKNAVIIAMYGNTAGKSAITRIPLTTNQACCNLVVDTEKADFRFIYYKILNDYELIKDLSIGGAQQNLNAGTIKNYEINLPPLPEQKAIASILSALDDKIELNLQMNKTLEEMAMTLYKHWFVDFGPFKDGKFIDSELGLIPEGWEVKKFGDLIDKIIDNRGKTPPLADSKTDYLLFETYQLTRDKLFPDALQSNKAKYVTEEIYNDSKWFRKGHPQFMDILFATVGNGIPNWSFMYENEGVGIAQNVVGIRSKPSVPPMFLRCSFESKLFLDQFDGYVITTAQPSIKLSDLNMINMVLPAEKVLKNWIDIVNNYVEQVYSNYKENQTLINLRDTLLPKLISGEVRLKDVEQTLAKVL